MTTRKRAFPPYHYDDDYGRHLIAFDVRMRYRHIDRYKASRSMLTCFESMLVK